MNAHEWLRGSALDLHPVNALHSDDLHEKDEHLIQRRILTGLLAFNGIGAIAGGFGILTGGAGLPMEMLDGTPFASYTIPGWILLVVVGGSSTLAAAMLWKRWRWANEAAVVAGGLLMGWIVTEFVMIPEGWLPQLLYFAIALSILALGLRGYREDNH